MQFFVRKTKIHKIFFLYAEVPQVVYIFSFINNGKKYEIQIKVQLYNDDKYMDTGCFDHDLSAFLKVRMSVNIINESAILYDVQKEILQRSFYLFLYFIKHDMIYFLGNFRGKKYITSLSLYAPKEVLNNLDYFGIFKEYKIEIDLSHIICRFNPIPIFKAFFNGYKIKNFLVKEIL